MPTNSKKSKKQSYAYYNRGDVSAHRADSKAALVLSEQRLHPSVRDLDYLVLRNRVSIFRKWINQLPEGSPEVLDIGGRIQPYRALFDDIGNYIGLDLIPEGLVDVIADAHRLPLADETFDVVICTQMLSYVAEPRLVISECSRVLKPGGTLLLTAPAFFPQHHDEQWRFTSQGIRSLLEAFAECEVVPECFSFAGLARSLNYVLHSDIENYHWNRMVSLSTIPMINLLGRALDHLSRGNEQCTPNYCARAVKPKCA